MRTVIQAIDAFPALVNLFVNFWCFHSIAAFVKVFLDCGYIMLKLNSLDICGALV